MTSRTRQPHPFTPTSRLNFAKPLESNDTAIDPGLLGRPKRQRSTLIATLERPQDARLSAGPINLPRHRLAERARGIDAARAWGANSLRKVERERGRETVAVWARDRMPENERERGDGAVRSTQREFERWRGEESIRMWGDGKREDEMRDRVRTMAEWEGRNGEEVEMPRMMNGDRMVDVGDRAVEDDGRVVLWKGESAREV